MVTLLGRLGKVAMSQGEAAEADRLATQALALAESLLCIRRLIVRVRSAAGVVGAAAVSFGYCLRQHQKFATSWKQHQAITAFAIPWCRDWRWKWVVIP